MKTLKSIGIITLAVLMLSCSALSASAWGGLMPLFDNCDYCDLSFIINNGEAYIGIDYDGQSTFLFIRISVQIQKKTLGLFWTTVDISEPNNTWVAYSYITTNYISNTFTLTETGTYRAVIDIEFHGTDGTIDYINDKIQRVY